MNRNKLGMVLDLKDIGDRDVFDRLISEADVFVHNMRPGSVEKLGVDATTLRTAGLPDLRRHDSFWLQRPDGRPAGL